MRTRAKKEGRIEEDEKAMKGREEKLKDGERETNAKQPMHQSLDAALLPPTIACW